MSGALSTLCAQAYGAKDYETLGLSLQRALLIMFTTCVPVSILWMCSESLFIMVGQKPSVAAAAAEYLMLLIPSLWTNAGVQSLQAWLYSMVSAKVE
jgi:MATE family multidrug resistance protein